MSIRLTEKRKRILSVLKNGKGVLSAGDIHKKLKDIDLVTIYRNLYLFTKEGLIAKVRLDTDEFLYEYQKTPHHHAKCSDCNKVIHFDAPDEKIKSLLGIKDFEIENIDLLVRGKCKH